ncbi:MAG: patatin family protein [Vibrio sp.]|uniref:patatin-like phospholipase family protein n=1 Tax=Vibrio TaxID=662 RepID=UPI001EB5B503|nr:patatin family protein [Vibrio sp.]NRB69388.1 patatin family protein [Vibrio sp.]
MKALVVEGGAMRGIFAAGVLDTLIDTDYYPYDFVIGVSAGASNLLGYLGKQSGRSYRVITELATDPKFFSPKRFIKGGDLIDVHWLVSESEQRFPLDKKQVFETAPMLAVATNINTGQADYYQLNHNNLSQIIEATSALPIAYKTTPCFSDGCYTDGGVADSIPVVEAYRRGATDITVVLSHPLSYEMPKPKGSWVIKRLLHKHPKIAEALTKRAQGYNQALTFIRHPPQGVKIRVIAPPENFSVKRLTMNKLALDTGYFMGIEEGKKHVASRKGLYGLDRENCHFCL